MPASTKKILFIHRVREEGMRLARERDDVEITVIESIDPADIIAAIADAHAVLVRAAAITRPVIDAAKSLMVVSRHGVGCETRAMIGEKELSALSAGAIVINTARGGIVVESALCAALRTGHIAGAGLDVFESEPGGPLRGDALTELDNVILSPHCAGVSLEAGIRMAQMAVQNILDTFDGRLRRDVVVNKDVLDSRANVQTGAMT